MDKPASDLDWAIKPLSQVFSVPWERNDLVPIEFVNLLGKLLFLKFNEACDLVPQELLLNAIDNEASTDDCQGQRGHLGGGPQSIIESPGGLASL